MESISAYQYLSKAWPEGQYLESELDTDQEPLVDKRQPGYLARFG